MNIITCHSRWKQSARTNLFGMIITTDTSGSVGVCLQVVFTVDHTLHKGSIKQGSGTIDTLYYVTYGGTHRGMLTKGMLTKGIHTVHTLVYQ